MKNLRYVLVALGLLLAPAFVLAQEVKPRPPVPLVPKARDIASTTKANIQDKKVEVRTLMQERKEEIKTILNTRKIATSSEARAEIRLKIETKKVEVQARIDAAKAKAKEKFGEAVQKSVGNIVNRLQKAVEHLTSIAERIDTHLAKLSSEGKDTDNAVALLAVARADIAIAQDKITAVGSALSAALASTNPKEQMPTVRAAVKAAEEAIKTAKESLKAVLESLRVPSASSGQADTSTNTSVTQ